MSGYQAAKVMLAFLAEPSTGPAVKASINAGACGRPCGPVRISAVPWIPRELLARHNQQQTPIIGVVKCISSILASSGNSNL